MRISGPVPHRKTSSAMSRHRISTPSLLGRSETHCACLAPAFMWECEYFCSSSGLLCSKCPNVTESVGKQEMKTPPLLYLLQKKEA